MTRTEIIPVLFTLYPLLPAVNYRSRTSMNSALDKDIDDDDEEYQKKGYSWETRFERSWDLIQEDPTTGELTSSAVDASGATIYGANAASAAAIAAYRKRKRRESKQSAVLTGKDDSLISTTRKIRKNIIRYVVLCLDLSRAMVDQGNSMAGDLKPSRLDAIFHSVESFIFNFFDQNPISQLSLILTRDATAQIISSFGSNPKHHINALKNLIVKGASGIAYGDASLQNAADLACEIVKGVPSYAAKEFIFIFGALSTCDPGDINETLDAVVAEKVRVSVIGLGAEVYIFRRMVNLTKGNYAVAINENHFEDILREHLTPPPTMESFTEASLIKMGFPMLKVLDAPVPCYNDNIPRQQGYVCPRCEAWLSEVPIECVLCGLALVTSPHIARSYHHLFPITLFAEPKEPSLSRISKKGKHHCKGCIKPFNEKELIVTCPKCENDFCIACDYFIHDSLHNCPGCLSKNIRTESLLASS